MARAAVRMTEGEALAALGEYLETLPETMPARGRRAAVFDIDGTLIPAARGVECSGLFGECHALCRARRLGVYVITARPRGPVSRFWTERQLEACGVRADGVIYSSARRKASARQGLRDSGMDLVAVFGDRYTDVGAPPELDSRPGVHVGFFGDGGAFCIKADAEASLSTVAGYLRRVASALLRGEPLFFGSLLEVERERRRRLGRLRDDEVGGSMEKWAAASPRTSTSSTTAAARPRSTPPGPRPRRA
jgi:hypothetical protein